MDDTWSRYRAGDPKALGDLVEKYLDLPRILARKALSRAPAWQDADDILSYAHGGLLDAISKFNPEVGVKFETYATRRITGAIKDGQRKDDPLVRSERKRVKDLDAAVARLRDPETCAEPSIEALSQELGWEREEVARVQLSRKSLAGSIDADNGVIETFPADSDADVELLITELRATVSGRISGLSETQRAVMLSIYVDELPIRDLSPALGIPRSACDSARDDMLRAIGN